MVISPTLPDRPRVRGLDAAIAIREDWESLETRDEQGEQGSGSTQSDDDSLITKIPPPTFVVAAPSRDHDHLHIRFVFIAHLTVATCVLALVLLVVLLVLRRHIS